MKNIFPYIICWVGLLTWTGYFSASAIEPPIPPPLDDFADGGEEVISQRPLSLQIYHETHPIIPIPDSNSTWKDEFAEYLCGGLILLLFGGAPLAFSLFDLFHQEQEHTEKRGAPVKLSKAELKEQEWQSWHKELEEFIESIPTRTKS